MGRIFDEMSAFFAADDWNTQQLEGKPILRTAFRGEDGHWTCYGQADEEREIFVFYSVAPVNVPDERRSQMAEFITRANYGMLLGNFEMDYADGEVRYKTSIDVEGTPLTVELAKRVVYANVLTLNRYLKGVLAVSFGGRDPAAAVADIEGH